MYKRLAPMTVATVSGCVETDFTSDKKKTKYLRFCQFEAGSFLTTRSNGSTLHEDEDEDEDEDDACIILIAPIHSS